MARDDIDGAHAGDGNTPLDEDESKGLIPSHLATRAELNQWEASNIDRALDWLATRTFDVLKPGALEEMHRRMFDETWEWAGSFRTSDKNISPFSWTEVPRLLRDLVENTRVQYDQGAKDPERLDDMAVHFHHQLVRIHPWPNGNGRHSRLATDLLLLRWGRPRFSWGAATHAPADVRQRYIEALRQADAGESRYLLQFVRS